MKNFKCLSWTSVLGLVLLIASCSSPKKIEPITTSEDSEVFNLVNPSPATESMDAGDPNIWHDAEIREVLQANRYSYLEVVENGNPFWLATSKGDFSPNQKLRYRGGLLKTNFKSEEHDRVFERLYLVSQLQVQGPTGNATEATVTPRPNPAKPLDTANLKGITSIKEIIQNPTKFKDQIVKILGTVTKVNPNILNRNWIHVKDTTADQYDFVLTSASIIPEGHQVIFEGVIRLDVDFGAGYSYDIIMEDAKFSLQ